MLLVDGEVTWSWSAPGRIRTCDTRFRRAVLYPLSYEGGPCMVADAATGLLGWITQGVCRRSE